MRRFHCRQIAHLVIVLVLAASSAAFAQQPATPPANNAAPATAPPADAPPAPGDNLVPTQPAFLMNVAVNRADALYSQGERLSMRFKSERDAHVYLLYHQADGKAVMIFPNKAQASNLVKAKQEISIPQARDSFRFRIGPPYGEEAMQVIASEKPIELLAKLDASSGRAVPVPKATLDDLAAAMKKAPGQFAEHRVVIHTQAGGGPLPEPRAPARVGLFVGVDKLKDPVFGEAIEQPRVSAEVMHKALTTLGGVAPDKARLITGEQATFAAFEQAMTKWLPSVTQPGDTVFIFYCGHGGQIPAIDQSEPDGLDEVLSTYDMEPKRIRETGVVDDRLARWLQELPGRQIVLLLETCHGGGIVDGRGMAGLMVDEANRVHDVSQLNTVVVCACLPDESSIFAKKNPTAFMPLLLERAMRELPKPVSVQAAYAFYRKNLPDLLADRKLGAGTSPYVQEPSLTDHALVPVILVPAASGGAPAASTPSNP